MQITVDIPETLPTDVVQRLLQQFEHRLAEEAEHLRASQPQRSKWAQIAQDAHNKSPLRGLSAYVQQCSQEIRDNFAFRHDEEE